MAPSPHVVGALANRARELVVDAVATLELRSEMMQQHGHVGEPGGTLGRSRNRIRTPCLRRSGELTLCR